METSKFDFAQGQKTITGLALVFLPLIVTRLGYTIEADSISSIVSMIFELAGSVLTVYGLFMKLYRFLKTAFQKNAK